MAAAVLLADKRILLVNHRKHGRSYWVLPGGHVNFGEPLRDALVREMKEELSLDVTVGPLLLVHEFLAEDIHVVNHTFRVETSSAEFRVKPNKVLKDARWIPLDELDAVELLPPITRELRKAVEDPPTNPIYLGRV
jgi:8-oxo-dGTP diphosphatase